MSTNYPSDVCIVLCCGSGAHEDGWISADEIARRLQGLGWGFADAPRIGNTLSRICRMDAPPVERQWRYGIYRYRLTPAGATWLHNRLPAVWYAERTYKDRERQGRTNVRTTA